MRPRLYVPWFAPLTLFEFTLSFFPGENLLSLCISIFSVKSDTVPSYLSAFGLFLLCFSHAVGRYFLVLLAGCGDTALLSAGNSFAHQALWSQGHELIHLRWRHVCWPLQELSD